MADREQSMDKDINVNSDSASRVMIQIDKAAMEAFQQLLRDGLLEAASAHEKAEQNNIAITTETTVRLLGPSAKAQEFKGRSDIRFELGEQPSSGTIENKDQSREGTK